MGVLKFRPNANSPWAEIPALVGPPGPKGDPGAPGLVPVKGVDYWTADDKGEIINSLRNDESFYPQFTVITLQPENWVNLSQTITVEGILADTTQQVIYVIPFYTNETEETLISCNIKATAQGENTITFSADELPTIAVQFYIKWERINFVQSTSGLSLEELLVDFEYEDNGDGTATITEWKGTSNGASGNRIIIPSDSRIII